MMRYMWTTVIRVIITGRNQICTEKKRASVTALISVPPRNIRRINSPITGIVPARSVPTVVAQYDLWFIGRRFPVKPIPSVASRRTTPVTKAYCQ